VNGRRASGEEAVTTLIDREPDMRELDAALALLVRAFDDDPFYVWLEPRASLRAELARGLLSFAMSGATVRVATSGDDVLGVIPYARSPRAPCTRRCSPVARGARW
jgi:hypothetical protein